MDNLLKEFNQKLDKIKDKTALVEFYRAYFGKKGIIKNLFLQVKKAKDQTQKKALALQIQKIQQLSQALFKKKEALILEQEKQEKLSQNIEDLDFSQPKIGHLHPITQTIRLLNDFFVKMGYSILDGPEIETDEFCFVRLNVPKNHPARDMQDTIYIKEPNYLLRTQTSSIEARLLSQFKPPFKVVSPGRVYRNEKVNKSNHFIFHHYQGVVVLEKVSLKDLFGTFTALFKKMYGEKVVIRYRNKYYPEVEPGVGPDMQCFKCQGKGCNLCKNVGWIEMGGAGIIHPNVLKMAGIDKNKWMGFAFGLGLDRWVMAKYQLTDIRTLLGGNLGYKPYNNENLI